MSSVFLVVFGLMAVGLLMLGIELLVIPGFGVAGLLGLAALGGSVYVAFDQLSAMYVGIVLVGSLTGCGVLIWMFPRSKLVLDAAITGSAVDESLPDLLHREGTALTVLRPSGSVDIDDRPIDAVTDGQYVEQGTRVKVVRVEGGRVVVEPIAQA